MNIKNKQTPVSLIPPVLITTQAGQVEKNWSELADSSKNFNSHNIIENFQYLDKRITAMRKTITAWDILKISAVAENINDFLALYSGMTPNSAIIYNCVENYKFQENALLTAGDIIYSDLENKKHIIETQSSGYYYPSSILEVPDTESYTLTYTYSTDNPEERADGWISPGSEALNKSYKNIKISEIKQGEPIDYNLTSQTAKTIKFPILGREPEIFYYYINSTKKTRERIYFDETISSDGSEYSVSLPSELLMTVSIEVR